MSNTHSLTDAELDDLEHDIRVAMDDLDLSALEAVERVVCDSDFVDENEEMAVGIEMLGRLREDN